MTLKRDNNCSKYCYPNTNVLINKFDIRSLDELHRIESLITTYKLSLLELGKIPFNSTLDIDHYLEIHKFVFGDIYDFAGEIRSEAIYKSNEPYDDSKMPFCYPEFIYTSLKKLLQQMKNSVHMIKSKEDLLTFISYYYVEINAIHPFREGNGRVLREFIREYVIALNKILPIEPQIINYKNWSSNNHNHLLLETIKSTKTDDISGLKELFNIVLEPVNNEKNKTA
jgi:Protein involved in cell division